MLSTLFGRDVEVWHIFEFEDGGFAKAMFTFDDEEPEEAAEGL